MPVVAFQRVRQVQVGGVAKDDLLRILERRNVSLNDYARTLFADTVFTTSDEEHEVRIAAVSLPELGLPDGGLYADIVDRAVDLGLQQCELELAPHLRLQYPDQPEGPYLTVASKKLRPDDSFPNGLYLRRTEGRLWLRGYNSGPDYIWPPDFSRFVFVYP